MSLFGLSLTIRARVLILVIVAMAPIVLERVGGLQVGRADRIRMTETTVRDLAKHGAEVYGQMLTLARTVMGAASLAQPEGDIDPQSCGRLMRDLDRGSDVIESLSIASPAGQMLCSSAPDVVGVDVGDRPFFKEAIATGRFTLSGLLVSRAFHRPILAAALPKGPPEHATTFVVVAALNLSWIEGLLADVLSGRNITASIVDRDGVLVARYPKNENLVDKDVRQTPLFEKIASGDSFTAPDLDGTTRIFATARLGDNAHLVVGVDRGQVLANISHQIDVAYVVIGCVVLFALLGAWWGSEHFILRPLRALAAKAGRYGEGDFSLKAVAFKWPPEFTLLNQALERMAQQLAARENVLIAENRQLETLAQLDGLTGLANRRCFDARLRAEWSASANSGEPLSLLMIDVDHFKRYNDRYGHPAGDACLRSIAASLSKGELRRNDFIARYGGEEFAVVLPSLPSAAAMEIGERLRLAVFDLALENNQSPIGRITISVGVAGLVGDGSTDAGALLEAADAALYNAKRRGRNIVSGRTSKLVDVLAG
ncbi:MAG: diguanylate cyclase [Xanthobacteraceae bacterium]|nr:diguanylate cyclase [Xanthobacteraceae bacterium]